MISKECLLSSDDAWLVDSCPVEDCPVSILKGMVMGEEDCVVSAGPAPTEDCYDD